MIERLAGIRRKRQEEDTEYEPERLPIRRCIPVSYTHLTLPTIA